MAYFVMCIDQQVPILLESNCAALLPLENNLRVSGTPSDALDPPKFTYMHAATANNTVLPPLPTIGDDLYPTAAAAAAAALPLHASSPHQQVSVNRPVKFQVRVLVCCGLADPDNERIDYTLPRKLR